ncbi:GW dipeptide domain-containing protein [Latilactobacillus sakei]
MRKSYQALLIALGLATSVSASSLLINDVHGATSAPVTIQQKLNVAKNMQITTNVYAGFSAPATLPDAKSLLAGDKVNGRNVRVVALYKVSDGTSYYNFKYGDQYYWMDSRAFTEVPAVSVATKSTVMIVNKQSLNKPVKVTTSNYAGFNTPATLDGAKNLIAGSQLNGHQVTAVAMYKLSDGTAYYNFKYGNRYYWMDVRAFTDVNTVRITTKQSLNKPVKVTTSNYAGFNTPATLDGAKNLITGSQLNGHQVTAVAMYKLSDGTAYYNFKYGSRYYWMDVRAFTDVNTVKITTKQSLNKPVKVTTSNYAGFNTPATLDGAKNLIAGSQLNGHQVTAVAMYKLSDGTAYYNFKYGNRYYWMDVRAFSNVAPTFKIVAKESVNKDARITANNYGGFNTPSPIPGAKYLISGSQLSGNVVHIVAKYKVSNGEWYYNFKFGDRYYWTNTRAFTDVASIVSKQTVNLNLIVNLGNYGGFNTPSPLPGAKYLISGSQVKGKVVRAVAKYKVSNGEYYYNFKYGDRYYWMNTRAFAAYGEVLMKTGYINQYAAGAPNGCEAASLYMGLRDKGRLKGYTFPSFLRTMPIATDLNPNHGFGGSPYYSRPGAFEAIFPAPLTNWAKAYGNVRNISGSSTTQIKDSLNQLHPVVAYVTIHFKKPIYQQYWWGRGTNNNHAVLVDGYRAGAYHVSDPIDGQYWINSAQFESVYNARKWALEVIS